MDTCETLSDGRHIVVDLEDRAREEGPRVVGSDAARGVGVGEGLLDGGAVQVPERAELERGLAFDRAVCGQRPRAGKLELGGCPQAQVFPANGAWRANWRAGTGIATPDPDERRSERRLGRAEGQRRVRREKDRGRYFRQIEDGTWRDR